MARRVGCLALLLSVLLLAAPAVGEAYQSLQNGILPDISWGYPLTNTDGSALTDLKEFVVYWRVGTGPETATVVPAATAAPTPATPRATKNDLLVPVLPCQLGTLLVQVSARDLTNNESAKSPQVSLVVDRRAECSPSVPSTLTVQ